MCTPESQVLAALYSGIHTGFSEAAGWGSTSHSPWPGLPMGSSCMTQSGGCQGACRELRNDFQHMLWLWCVPRGSQSEEPTPVHDQLASEARSG